MNSLLTGLIINLDFKTDFVNVYFILAQLLRLEQEIDALPMQTNGEKTENGPYVSIVMFTHVFFIVIVVMI